MSNFSRNTTGESIEVEQDYAVMSLVGRSQPEIDAVLAQVDETSRQRIAHGISLVRKYGDGLARSFGLSDEVTVMVPRGMISDGRSVGGGVNTTTTLDLEDHHGDMGYYGGAGSHEDLDGK